MDKLQAMQVFVAVADAGSFVQAADALGMSKATVSRHVADLEAHLGVRLLHRTTRKLSLTPEGLVFHARCATLLADMDEAEAEITARTGQATGVLRVNVPFTFGVQHLAPLWAGFMAQHPHLTLDVTLADRVVDLVEEGFDLAVRIASLPSSSLISRRLATTRLVLCASPAYLARRGTPQHPTDLAQHDVLAYSLLAMGDVWAFDNPAHPTTGRVDVKVVPRLRTNNGDTCRIAAVQGLGLILQPAFLVSGDLRSGALVEVLPAFRAAELGVYAVYPSRQHVAPKVRLLIDYLAQAFSTPRW